MPTDRTTPYRRRTTVRTEDIEAAFARQFGIAGVVAFCIVLFVMLGVLLGIAWWLR